MKLPITVAGVAHPTPDSTTLFFAWPFAEPPAAGQYVQLSVVINAAWHTRSYSVHPGRTAPEVGITIRKIAGGLVSEFMHHRIEPGAQLWVEGPMGNFTLRPGAHPKHLFMLAGGSGITPIYAMINEVLRTAATDTISLLFVNHHYSRIIFRDELESLQATSNGRFTVDHILSDAGGVPEGFRPFSVGRPGKLVVKSWLRARRTPAPAEEYYLCGPHGLLNVFDQALQQSGIAPTQIAKEHFFVPEAGQPTPLFPQQTVALRWHKQTKKVVVPSGTTILQAALHAGISAPFSCQKGQCGTCTARLVEGNVHMSHNYALSGEQLQEGLVLLCQSHPTTENVTLELAI